MDIRNIPTAPAAPSMFGDDFPEIAARLDAHNRAVRKALGFREFIAGMTFHEDDVPEFGAFEAHEVLAETLGEFGWDAVDQHVIEWGDSGTPATWRVQVLPLGQLVVSRFDGSANIVAGMRVTFEGSWREIVPAALAFLADHMAG